MLGQAAVTSHPVVPAADNGGAHICLTNHARYCLNLFRDRFRDGQFVVMFDHKGTGLGWRLVKVGTVCGGGRCGKPRPFKGHTSLNRRFNGRPYYKIMKTKGRRAVGCLGEQNFEGIGLLAVWAKSCSAFNADRWVYTKDKRLVSVNLSSFGSPPTPLAADGVGNNNDVCFCTDSNDKWNL